MRCSTHNREMRQIGPELVCPACLALASADSLRTMDSLAERQAARALEARLLQAQIPSRFEGATFEAWRPVSTRAAELCSVMTRFASGFATNRFKRSGFIFSGPPGTGKTHMACAILHSVVTRGFTGRYLSIPSFTRAVKASYGKSGQTDLLIRGAVDADFLVLDEIDLHGTSDVDYNVLYDIINSRYEREGAPVLVISNRPLERLVVDLDARIISRILGSQSPILFDWPSQRCAPSKAAAPAEPPSACRQGEGRAA